MAVNKTYTEHGVTDFSSIYNALVTRGIRDAAVTLEPGGPLVILSATGEEATADGAVADAVSGGLFHNKALRIAEIARRSEVLMSAGVGTWVPGAFAELSKDDAAGYFTAYEYLAANAGKLSVAQPYTVYTLGGRAVQTSDIAEAKALADDAVDRMVYIYTAVSNGDGSAGEIKLITSITGAANQAALDSIVDTRA